MFLATAAHSPQDILSTLIMYLAQYGIFGAAFFDLLVTRKLLVPKWDKTDAVDAQTAVCDVKQQTIDEKNEDIKALKLSLDQLQALTRDQMLPALVRANQLSADYLQLITRRSYEDDIREQKRRSRDKEEER